MKIAIAGKGGVGKTTLAALLARSYAADGYKVLAIDADPDANLAAAVGLPRNRLGEVKPVAEMKDLAAERTGHSGGFGGMFKLNPTVDDLPEALSALYAGVRIMALGSVEHGGGGCICPEHALLRALMTHILVRRNEIVIMDMEAGVEHLGRGTADCVDVLVIVVEPGQRSLDTAQQIERLAADLGIVRVGYVGSKVATVEELTFLRSALPSDRLLGILTFDARLRDVDREGKSPWDVGERVVAEAVEVRGRLERWARGTHAKGASQCAG